jgi:hypothetical protein
VEKETPGDLAREAGELLSEIDFEDVSTGLPQSRKCLPEYLRNTGVEKILKLLRGYREPYAL